MFYLIGLGLGDAKDITVKGLEIVKSCDIVYLESYTSILSCSVSDLEKFYEKPLVVADRELVEQGDIIDDANEKNIALLVVGDPFGATTHTDLILRAKEKGIKVKVVHNASILNAAGSCGLQLYSFGETVSIPYWTDSWKPDSFFDKIVSNYSRNLHTLCLLDIKVKEPTLESLTKKKREYMPPMFMSVAEASQQLLAIIGNRSNENGDLGGITKDSLVIGLARVGSENEKIVLCSLEKMSEYDLGKPLHSLVFPGPNFHPLESEYLEQFKL